MICKICTKKTKKIFMAQILHKYDIQYYHCEQCGFLQTEEPFWLEEAYTESINVSDTGYLQRNINLSNTLTILLSTCFNKDKIFLDYAGGYGIFVRLMRDIGFDFYWDDKYTQNLFAKGFEYLHNDTIEAITTFESFEHFVEPMQEIDKMLQISKNIIFSTELLQTPIPNPKDWWYYGLEHGQHISFYTEKTFHFIAQKYNLNYYNMNGLHILTEKSLPKSIKYILKFSRFGLFAFYAKQIKSKTWNDHLQMSQK